MHTFVRCWLNKGGYSVAALHHRHHHHHHLLRRRENVANAQLRSPFCTAVPTQDTIARRQTRLVGTSAACFLAILVARPAKASRDAVATHQTTRPAMSIVSQIFVLQLPPVLMRLKLRTSSSPSTRTLRSRIRWGCLCHQSASLLTRWDL